VSSLLDHYTWVLIRRVGQNLYYIHRAWPYIWWFLPKYCIPYRLGFSPQPQKNILVSHSRINPAPWKYSIYTNPAQGFLPDRLQNTPKIPVFQSRTPKINRYFSCAQSPRRAKNDIFARWYKVCTVYTYIHCIFMVLTNPNYVACVRGPWYYLGHHHWNHKASNI